MSNISLNTIKIVIFQALRIFNKQLQTKSVKKYILNSECLTKLRIRLFTLKFIYYIKIKTGTSQSAEPVHAPFVQFKFKATANELRQERIQLRYYEDIPYFAVSTAILNIIDISRKWCKLNFGSMRGQVKSRDFPDRIDARRQ